MVGAERKPLRRASVESLAEKVISVEREFSPFGLEVEKGGFMRFAKEAGIAVASYSPLRRGLATGAKTL